MRRVVVTGIGMCTPLGYGVDINWKKLISSQSGIRKLEGFEIGAEAVLSVLAGWWKK